MNNKNQTYKLTLRASLKMLRFSFFSLIAMCVCLPILDWLKVLEITFDSEMLKIFFIVYFIIMLPALYLHIEYFIINYKSRLTIDSKSQRLHIIKGSKSYDYNFDDVIVSKLYRSIYYKNGIDNANRWKMAFSDYGYWFVRFSDKKRFFFTSLMIDTSKAPIIKNTEIKYPFFTNIKRNELTKKDLKRNNQQDFENTVNYYIDKFKDLNASELNSKIENHNSFQKEAIEACKRLLRNKYEC